jgi:NAD(P)H dehydrogenase (quinone)
VGRRRHLRFTDAVRLAVVAVPHVHRLAGRAVDPGKLADKAYAGFTSSQTAHGGQETTLLALYITLMHFGGIIVPPGYTEGLKFVDGNPYGVSHITGPENKFEINDATAAALDHLARRVVSVADRLVCSAPDNA